MKGSRFTPRGYSGRRRAPDQVKREGWREQGVLAVAIDDERLTWPSGSLSAARRQALRNAEVARHD